MEDLVRDYEHLMTLLRHAEQRLDKLEGKNNSNASQTQTKSAEEPPKQQQKIDVRAAEKSDSIQFTMLENFLKKMLAVLPTQYSTQDSNRMTLAYFVVGGLDVIGKLSDKMKSEIVPWIYSLQTLPDKDNADLNFENCGWKGGSFFGKPYNPECKPSNLHKHEQSHITMTYTALAILAMCGDDFSKVNKRGILRATKSLQREDGSFAPVAGGSENDMRFVYCAASICTMLGDWSGMNVDKATEYILSSQSYDFGIAQGPGQESHGGSTYCALAALKLMGKLSLLKNKPQLVKWCVDRQLSGFQGRINKIPDTCYSFWIGASLCLLEGEKLIDSKILRAHTMSCQKKIGGFGKWPDQPPDVLHTYFSLCGLSLLAGETSIATIDPALGFNIERTKRFYKK